MDEPIPQIAEVHVAVIDRFNVPISLNFKSYRDHARG